MAVDKFEKERLIRELLAINQDLVRIGYLKSAKSVLEAIIVIETGVPETSPLAFALGKVLRFTSEPVTTPGVSKKDS